MVKPQAVLASKEQKVAMIPRFNFWKMFFGTILSLLCMSSYAVAQSNYLEGYIISNAGDTTFGKIHYPEWVETPDSILFRKDEVKQVFKPNDIDVFSVAGEIYVSAKVDIYKMPQGQQQVYFNTKLRSEIVNEEVFLRTLVKSEELSLFMHKGNRENFYLKKGGGYLALISNRYIIEQEGKHVMNTANKYKYINQLRAINYDCMDLVKEDLDYSEKSLIDFVTSCNEILGAKNRYVYKTEKVKFQHGIVAGTGVADFNAYLPYENIVKYNSSYYFNVGYSVDFILPRKRGKRVVNTELSYSYFQGGGGSYSQRFLGESCNNNPQNCNVFYEDEFEEAEVTLGYLDLKISYVYKFLSEKIRPKILLGTSLGKLLHSNTTTEVNRRIYNREGGSTRLIESLNNKSSVFVPENFVLNFHGGVGVEYGNYSLAMVYQPHIKTAGVGLYQSFVIQVKYVFIR